MTQGLRLSQHEGEAISLQLPLPPSMNTYWRSWVRPGTTRPMVLLSSDGRTFQKDVQAAWLSIGKPPPMRGRLCMTIMFYAATRRKYDIDNRIKSLQDALAKAGAFEDDNQIDELHVYRGPLDPPHGRCEVTIEPLPAAAGESGGRK